jgi:hypothetical protein
MNMKNALGIGNYFWPMHGGRAFYGEMSQCWHVWSHSLTHSTLSDIIQ